MGIDTNVTTITNQNSLFLQYSRALIKLMITRFSVKNTRSYLHGNEEGKKIFDVVFFNC